MLAHDVASRTHEIGLRVALGAGAGTSCASSRGGRSASSFPGIVIGLVGAAMSTSAVENILISGHADGWTDVVLVAITLVL